MQVLNRLWREEDGVTYTIEVILVATIASLGLIVGLTTLRDSVTNELADVAGAVDDIVQSYTYDGITGHSAEVSGADFNDETDFCDDNDDTATVADQCVVNNTSSGNEEGTPLP